MIVTEVKLSRRGNRQQLTGAGFEARDSHHPVRNGTSMAKAQVELVNLKLVHGGYIAIYSTFRSD
jgi:hypothetical protein